MLKRGLLLPSYLPDIKKDMKRILCLALAFVASIPLIVQATPESDKEIKEVVEAFRRAIIERDEPGFLALFVSPEVTWQSVIEEGSLAQLRERDPDAVKAKYRKELNAEHFIDGIVASRNTSEETFSNIKIDTDGEVATVSFDYTFLSNGKKTNWGKECWLLVRTQEGWKITTLAYSIVLPPDAVG